MNGPFVREGDDNVTRRERYFPLSMRASSSITPSDVFTDDMSNLQSSSARSAGERRQVKNVSPTF